MGTDFIIKEALYRVSKNEYARNSTLTFWGKINYDNIGKNIRVRLAQLIYAINIKKDYHNTFCAAQWIIDNLKNDVLPHLHVNDYSIQRDIDNYITTIEILIENYKNRYNCNIDTTPFDTLIRVAGMNINTFIWHDKCNGGQFGNFGERFYTFYDTPQGKLSWFCDLYLR